MERTRKRNGRTDGWTDEGHFYNPPSASRLGIKKAEVVILVCDMSSGPVLHYYQVSSKYSKECSTYIADTKSMHNQCQILQREITAKGRQTCHSCKEHIHRLVLFYSSTKYLQNILKGILVTEQMRNLFQTKQEAHGPWVAHLSE